ncbi:MAG: sigma-70 family RNA polymerase sigma factor [Actinomycetota bacterium]
MLRARDGDLDAFDELVRRHQHSALRVAAAVAGSDRAEDATQEGFVRAHRKLHQFDVERPFRPWLLRVVANAARNELRSAGRHQRIELRVHAHPERAGTPDPIDRLGDRELVADGLARLRTDDRTILALRWFADLSEAEIADTLGVARGTVKSRLSRAMGRLRAAIPTDQQTTDGGSIDDRVD